MSFDVNPGAMRAHANQVLGLVAQADQASGAAAQVAFQPQMYGLIGAALVYPLIAPLEGAGVAATGYVSDALSETASAVNGMADTFEFVDTAVTKAMDGLRGLTS